MEGSCLRLRDIIFIMQRVPLGSDQKAPCHANNAPEEDAGAETCQCRRQKPSPRGRRRAQCTCPRPPDPGWAPAARCLNRTGTAGPPGPRPASPQLQACSLPPASPALLPGSPGYRLPRLPPLRVSASRPGTSSERQPSCTRHTCVNNRRRNAMPTPTA